MGGAAAPPQLYGRSATELLRLLSDNKQFCSRTVRNFALGPYAILLLDRTQFCSRTVRNFALRPLLVPATYRATLLSCISVTGKVGINKPNKSIAAKCPSMYVLNLKRFIWPLRRCKGQNEGQKKWYSHLGKGVPVLVA